MNNIPEGLEKFDYAEAMKRPDDVVTRDGRPAKIGGCNHSAIYALVGWINNEVNLWRNNGKCVSRYKDPAPNDLFLKAKTITVYRNDYGLERIRGGSWNTLQCAIGSQVGNCSTTKAIAVVAYTYQSNKLIKVEIAHTY